MLVMARTYVPNDSIGPYHITARTVNRMPFALGLSESWRIFEDGLFALGHFFKFKVANFVLMPNHIHSLIWTPEQNLSEGVGYFLRETAREMNRHSGRINQVFGGRFHRSLIEHPNYLTNVYKYIYRNPVEAGLVTRCEDYLYSTLRGCIGFRAMCIPLVEDELLMSDPTSTIDWLNRNPCGKDREAIRRALKRSRFQLPRDPANHRPHRLEIERY
jgi:putative transposase